MRRLTLLRVRNRDQVVETTVLLARAGHGWPERLKPCSVPRLGAETGLIAVRAAGLPAQDKCRPTMPALFASAHPRIHLPW
jgi:hypothetical protein